MTQNDALKILLNIRIFLAEADFTPHINHSAVSRGYIQGKADLREDILLIIEGDKDDQ